MRLKRKTSISIIPLILSLFHLFQRQLGIKGKADMVSLLLGMSPGSTKRTTSSHC
jgi:hypothetical protein